MSTGQKILSGVLWTSFQTLVNRSFSFIIKLVLARLLFPEDYGIVGMATVFISFITVFNDLGIGAALIQRKEDELTENHFHTAFWTSVGFSILLYAGVSIGIGQFAVWFYGKEILGQLIPVLAIGILATPINVIHKAQLKRDLKFKKLAFIDNAANIFSGILALGLAFWGAGVWALVFNSVTSIIVAIPLYFYATKWIPKWEWDKKCFYDIFGFGVFTTFTGFFNRIKDQIDYILIGKLIGASALGIYSFAFIIISSFRSQLTGIIGNVMYPIYAQLQDNIVQLRSNFLKVVKYNTYLVYPIMFYLVVFAEDLIPSLFGKKWNESVIIIQILGVAVIIQMLTNSDALLLRAYGKAKLELQMQMIKAIFIYVPLITLGTLKFGVIGAALGFGIGKILDVIYSLIIINKIFGITVFHLLNAIRTALLSGVVSSIISYSLLYFGWNWLLVSAIFIVNTITFYWVIAKNEFLLLLKFIKK
jgi:teichuronic acid exporter